VLKNPVSWLHFATLGTVQKRWDQAAQPSGYIVPETLCQLLFFDTLLFLPWHLFE
jgi:hypothetical protein